MASYTNSQNIYAMIPHEIVVQLTDDVGLNEVDINKVNYSITLASDLIDGYLMGHYTLPLPYATPPLIMDICTKLSVYFLYQRSLLVTMPESLKEAYKWCLDTLKGIQISKINPFPITENSPLVVGGSMPPGGKQGRFYTRNWKDYFIKGWEI
jgi:phage gp36-like protein